MSSPIQRSIWFDDSQYLVEDLVEDLVDDFAVTSVTAGLDDGRGSESVRTPGSGRVA